MSLIDKTCKTCKTCLHNVTFSKKNCEKGVYDRCREAYNWQHWEFRINNEGVVLEDQSRDKPVLEDQRHDNVNYQSHYTKGCIECIDAIASALTPDEFSGYLKGNVLKYTWRSGSKGDVVEDLKKAEWHLKKLINHLQP